MELDTIVATVLEGKAVDNDISQRLKEQLAKLAAKVNCSDNENSKKTIFERILQAKIAFDWGTIKPIFAQEKQFQKSSEVSTKLRERGNELYKQKNADAALRAYSLAIAFAPIKSEQLCTAYANRSAVLIQKSRVSEALGDIERALEDEQSCPVGLRGPLQDRKRKCEALLGETEGEKSGTRIIGDLNDVTNKLFEIQEPNPKIPNAESFVKLQYTREKGRHLVVTKDVKAGSVLMVDRPFVSVLSKLLKWETNHCHNCSTAIFGGIPCNICTFAMFCSENCRERASNDEHGIHRFEHNYLPILHALNTTHGEIQALRILALIGPKGLDQMCQAPTIYEDGNQDFVMGFNEQGIYDVKTYLPTFRLISHEQRSTSDDNGNTAGIKTALKALTLKEMLKEYSQFFNGNWKASNREDLEDFAAALLLKHLESIKYNAISLSKLAQVNEKQKSIAYAAALYPLISLCNHSCDPNCAPVKQSKHLVTSLIALKALKEGDELFITYKPLYTFMKTSERQKFLAENYLFICNCQPCEENWGPANVQLQGNGATLVLQPSRCVSCDAPENNRKKQCHQCALKDVNRAKEIHMLGAILFECHDFLEQEKWQQCLQKLPKVVDYFGRNGFNSYFPLYHVALDLYKRALVHSVAHL